MSSGTTTLVAQYFYRSFLIFSIKTWFIHSPAYHSCPDITCCLFVFENREAIETIATPQ